MKKTLSLILALLMSVSCASFAFADEAEEEVLLDDVAIAEEAEEEAVEVEEPSLYDEAIDFLNAYGIYKGYGADKMGANDDIQRYQMALFTSRIATGWVDDAAWNTGIWDAAYTEFTDVNEAPAANYLGAISYANQNGIIEGYGDGRFGPTDGITYQNALTMVVRALGYQNLNWPWGYIEKAVTLGLTDGIVDVAYTDVLTRGEVAQVIYNALFAETKDGTTLGAKNFDIEFGWETIIITAAGGAFYAPNGKAVDEGVIGFKVVDKKTGELTDDTYYAKSSEKAFADFVGHKDELAVGKAFRACYGKDGILAAKSLYNETLWNYGPDTTDVKDYFDGKSAVSKYTETTYVNANGKIAYDGEVIIAEGTYGTNQIETEIDHEWYVIDWTNGNILVAVDDDEDGKIDLNDDDEKIYTVAWYYNELLDQYYNVKTNADGKDDFDVTIEIVGIDLMDEDDAEKLVKAVKSHTIETPTAVNGYNILTSIPAYSAYASLDLFDLDGHDYGVYTSYRLGKIHQETKNCGHGDHQFVVVDNLASAIAEETFKLIDGKEYKSNPVDGVICGECSGASDKCEEKHNDIWWTDDFAPKADEETGKIITNYVLYNFNKVTKELRVLETLEAQTGVLRAYNLDKRTINIDGETLYFDYDALEGNMFADKDSMNNSYKTKAITASYLKGLFNQFVEYVVVDGKIVFVEAKAAGTNNYLVVESYAGVSSDGYIVVNAYSTADLKLGQYRIGSYNGWEKGDYFYYLDDATAEDSFSRGVIYDVSSYDKENDVYYVELIGEVSPNSGYSVYNTEVSKYSELVIDEDGYITVKSFKSYDKTTKTNTYNDAADIAKVSADDKWVIIGADKADGKYVPMAVYTGKATKGWKIDGEFEAIQLKDHLFIIVNANFNNVDGFDYDEYAASYVVFLGNKKNSALSATYDVYGNEEAEWYLLGASTYDVNVLDLMDGKEKVVTAQNMKLRAGNIYITLDGKIVDDDKMNIGEAFDAMEKAYADTDAKTATADYLFGDEFNSSWINKDGFVKKDEGSFAEWLYNSEDYELEDSKYHKGVEISGKVIDLTIDENGLVENFKDVTDADDKYWDDDNTYGAFWIYDVDAKSVVIYVAVAATETETEVEGQAFADVLEVGSVARDTVEAYVTGAVDATKTTVEYADDTKEYAYDVTGLEFAFDGTHTKGTHANVFNDIFFFGSEGSCDLEHWYVNVTVSDGVTAVTTPVSTSIVGVPYDDHTDEDAYFGGKCDLVKSVKVGVSGLSLKAGETKFVRLSFVTEAGQTELVAKITVNEKGELAACFDPDATPVMVVGRILDAAAIVEKVK